MTRVRAMEDFDSARDHRLAPARAERRDRLTTARSGGARDREAVAGATWHRPNPSSATQQLGTYIPEYECNPEPNRLIPTKLNRKVAYPQSATYAAARPCQPAVARA